jgi:hypothetical protein
MQESIAAQLLLLVDYFFAFELGLPAFSSFEAAAALCVPRFVAALCGPGSGLQLPFVPGFLPGTGSKPGQQGLTLAADFFEAAFFVDFFAVAISTERRRLRQPLLYGEVFCVGVGEALSGGCGLTAI